LTSRTSAGVRRHGDGPLLRALSSIPALGYLLVLMVIPLGLVIAYAFLTSGRFGGVQGPVTFDNIARLFQPLYLEVLLSSVVNAGLATFFAFLIGFPAALAITRLSSTWQTVALIAVVLPFWTNFLIRTYAWISILSEQGLANSLLLASRIFTDPLPMMYTPFSIVLGLVYNYLPFMILPIYTSVEKLDNSLVEAAYDLGAGPMRAFSRVIIPLTKPGIAAGALLVFVPAIAMYAITTLMGGGSNPTIGEVIQNQFTKARNQPFGAALGVLLLAIFIFSLWISQRMRREEPS